MIRTMFTATAALALTAPALAAPPTHGGGGGAGGNANVNAGAMGGPGSAGINAGVNSRGSLNTSPNNVLDRNTTRTTQPNTAPSTNPATGVSQGPSHASTNGIAHANSHSVLASGQVPSSMLPGLATGLTVQTSAGATLGTVSQVVTDSSGNIRLVIVTDTATGATFRLAPSTLSISGGVVTTTSGT